jgi:hypothetical protein
LLAADWLSVAGTLALIEPLGGSLFGIRDLPDLPGGRSWINDPPTLSRLHGPTIILLVQVTSDISRPADAPNFHVARSNAPTLI